MRTPYDAQALRLIEACGARVKFLPPYRPDFNPMEKMWSQMKTLLRGWAARTQDELSAAITQAFNAITPEDAQGGGCLRTTIYPRLVF